MNTQSGSGSIDSANAPLRLLFEAIALRDASKVSGLLARFPELARSAVVIGASRQEAKTYFFEAIFHYAYAGDTPLHFAAAAYAPGMAQDLISRGAGVRARNRRGAEPIHYAADGAPDTSYWEPAAQAATIDLLIRAGANPNAMDKGEVSPLHRAVRTRCASAVRALLAGGAAVHIRNKSGSTPLHLAVQNTGRGGTGETQAREQQAEIIRVLLEHGATPSDKDAGGKAVRDSVKAEWICALLK